MRTQRGFTLIELIVVIVILGILAATALPKFVNLQDDAAKAAVDGIAAAITSATSINYAKYQVSPGAAQTITTATTCSNIAANTNLLIGGVNTADATLAATANGCPSNGGSVGTCTVSSAKVSGVTAAASIICTN